VTLPNRLREHAPSRRRSSADAVLTVPIARDDGTETDEKATLRTNISEFLSNAAGGSGAGATPVRKLLRVIVIADFAVFTVPSAHDLPAGTLMGLRVLAAGDKTPQGQDLVTAAVILCEWMFRRA